MKVVQCESCGRVRGAGTLWIDDPTAKVDIIGFCSLCGRLKNLRDRARFDRECRRTERRAATGKLKAKTPKNPFQGF